MNSNQFRKQEFEKRRVFKKATSLCNAYSCPIFQNCLLEIKQLQQENARLKDKNKKAIDKLEFYNSGEALWYVPIQEIIDILKEN